MLRKWEQHYVVNEMEILEKFDKKTSSVYT